MRAGLAALALSLVLACGRTPAPQPNLILISIDTLRRDALRADGAPEAPQLAHLDAFAAESVRFQYAVAAASWTLPSHGSLLTGLYPERHGATDARVQLAPDVGTLAEALRARGYQTSGFTNGGFLDGAYGFGRGFDDYDARGSSTTDPADSTLDRAAGAIAGRRDGRPLFLFIQTYSVHDYFGLRPWAVQQLETPPARHTSEYVKCLQGTLHCDAEDWHTLRALYDAELHHLDDCFGRLRAALVAAGLWDTSLIVFTADHGEGFDPARGRMHHGGRLHEDLLRVPLWVHGPGLAAHDVQEPVSLVDVMPTLLELAGAPIPSDLDGRSFARTLRGDPPARRARPLYASEYYYAWWHGARIQTDRIRTSPNALAVIEGDRWFLWSPRDEELYDIASDPHQQHNLAGTTNATELRGLAEARRVGRVATPRIERMDESLRAQLEALGYAQ